MDIGDRVNVPSPADDSPNWTVYRTGTVTAVDGDRLTVRLTNGQVRQVGRDECLTTAEIYAAARNASQA